MANLSTRFFGLDLKSPIIAGSSSLTAKIDQIEKISRAGAGAVVLKSLFEEEIHLQFEAELGARRELAPDPEYLDYFDYVIKDESLGRYIQLVADAKRAVDIPVVASISCTSSSEWTQFARKIEEAGADALELNLFIIPSNESRSHAVNEQFYFDTVKKVLEVVRIPVSVKISHYFSNLAKVVSELSQTGIAGITLFNRFYTPDIDINLEEVINADVLSNGFEYQLPLRWTGILSSKAACPLAGTSGIMDAETAIKFLLAGANAVQIASAIYLEGPEIIEKFNTEIARWMDAKGYQTIDEFKGKLCLKTHRIDAWERSQFMNYFGGFSY
ncbi:dihydroorotate dehydrogenase-like protein [Mangrovibacterium lignilyticum]|uniref:dihydroorotate dehydrogenase-like protein n=1 Tax=Mangrovibacterium lignilyticum TaxID=2668052 RepID=UPI0013D5683D|nr:dihydroorotate dehydrogenase-like protein [Mangrovibacterium lignilyticum]